MKLKAITKEEYVIKMFDNRKRPSQRRIDKVNKKLLRSVVKWINSVDMPCAHREFRYILDEFKTTWLHVPGYRYLAADFADTLRRLTEMYDYLSIDMSLNQSYFNDNVTCVLVEIRLKENE